MNCAKKTRLKFSHPFLCGSLFCMQLTKQAEINRRKLISNSFVYNCAMIRVLLVWLNSWHRCHRRPLVVVGRHYFAKCNLVVVCLLVIVFHRLMVGLLLQWLIERFVVAIHGNYACENEAACGGKFRNSAILFGIYMWHAISLSFWGGWWYLV